VRAWEEDAEVFAKRFGGKNGRARFAELASQRRAPFRIAG
jgi:hypothetical protein